MADHAVHLRRPDDGAEIPMAWVAPRAARAGQELREADLVQPYPTRRSGFVVVTVWPWLRETDEKGTVRFTREKDP